MLIATADASADLIGTKRPRLSNARADNQILQVTTLAMRRGRSNYPNRIIQLAGRNKVAGRALAERRERNMNLRAWHNLFNIDDLTFDALKPIPAFPASFTRASTI